MKEVILALMLGVAFCYELLILIKAESYVRAMYRIKKADRSENDKTIYFSVGCFGIIYLGFIVLGMAISDLWYVYLIIFLLSIGQTPINNYFKRNHYWGALVQFKRLDSLISLGLIAFLFFGHFHPEVISGLF